MPFDIASLASLGVMIAAGIVLFVLGKVLVKAVFRTLGCCLFVVAVIAFGIMWFFF